MPDNRQLKVGDCSEAKPEIQRILMRAKSWDRLRQPGHALRLSRRQHILQQKLFLEMIRMTVAS
jgi:hypothetical protein